MDLRRILPRRTRRTRIVLGVCGILMLSFIVAANFTHSRALALASIALFGVLQVARYVLRL